MKWTTHKKLKERKSELYPLNTLMTFPTSLSRSLMMKVWSRLSALIRSIDLNSVLTPVIARKKEDERYELIFGHRRKHTCEVLGLELIPIIVRDMSRDEAAIEMVDSNLQREHILPSEKAGRDEKKGGQTE